MPVAPVKIILKPKEIMPVAPVGIVTIKNMKHKEMLYSGDEKLDPKRRHVLTWIGGKHPPCSAKSAQWEIVLQGNGYYRIRNAATKEWLYAGLHLYNDKRRYVLTWSGEVKHETENTFWEIVASGANFLIRSVTYQEHIYVNDPKLSKSNRYALQYIPGGNTSRAENIWCIEKVPQSNLLGRAAKLELKVDTLQSSHLQEVEALQSRHLAHIAELQIKTEELQDLNHQLQLQNASLEERSKQQETIINKLEQEKLSLRGELGEQIGMLIQTIRPLVVSPSPMQASSIAASDHGSSSWVDVGSQPSLLSDGTNWDAEVVLREDATSVHTAPASFYMPQCVLPSALFKTPGGVCAAADMLAGTELQTRQGGTITVKKSFKLPEQERDFVEVLLDGGSFDITGDHFLSASRVGQPFGPVLANELTSTMMLEGTSGPLVIRDVQRKPAMPTGVVLFELEDPTKVVLMELGVGQVCIFGSPPPTQFECRVNHLKGSCDVVELGVVASKKAMSEPRAPAKQNVLVSTECFPPSAGSHQHPNCAGACNLYKKGKCKYGASCMSCHVSTCTKHKDSRGKEQRSRAKKRDREAGA